MLLVSWGGWWCAIIRVAVIHLIFSSAQHSIDSHANIYGRHIVPVVSLA